MTKMAVINDGITSLVANLGTDRDKAASVEYVAPVQQETQLENAYRTSWLAKKIVDIPAFDSFRRWRSWQASKDQIEKLEAEEKRLDIKAKMLSAETLARLYGGAAVYMDLGDDPTKPAPTKIKLGGIRFVTVMNHRQLAPGEIELDPMSQAFGKPKWYTVAGGPRGEVRIHPSRLILRYGCTRPDVSIFADTQSVWGDSVLYSLMSSVAQFDGTTANVASLIYESKVDVIAVSGLMEIAGDPIREAQLLQRYRLAAQAKGNNGMLIIDKENEEYSQKTATFQSLADLMDRFAQNASGGADIPATRLFSQAPAGMNATGESDLRNYYDRLSAHQELNITPAMLTFDELLIQSALGTRPPEVHYIWSSLWQISDSERAELGAKNATTIKTMHETGLLADETLAESLVSMMVESSVIPGLEESHKKHGMPPPDDEEEEDDAPGGGGGPGGGKPSLRVVGDAQPRAPKGSANGGQWVKGGGGGAGSAKAAALAAVASKAYPAEAIEALLDKPSKGLTQGEYKKVLAYKKALQAQQTATKKVDIDPDDGVDLDFEPLGDVPGAGFGNPSDFGKDKVPTAQDVEALKAKAVAANNKLNEAYLSNATNAQINAAEKEATAANDQYTKAFNQKAKADKLAAEAPEVDLNAKLAKVKAESESALEAYLNSDDPAVEAEFQAKKKAYNDVVKEVEAKLQSETPSLNTAPTAAKPDKAALSAAEAKTKALASVATSAYPAEKIESLLNKPSKEMTQGEYKKVLAYKKALQAEQAASLTANAQAKAAAPVPPAPKATVEGYKAIGSKYHGMTADTVAKLASGEYTPDPKKPWQANAAAEAKEYLATGVLKTPAPSSGPAKWSNQYGSGLVGSSDGKITPADVSAKGYGGMPIGSQLATLPPPVTSTATPQTKHAQITTPLNNEEHSHTHTYTTGAHKTINKALRAGNNSVYTKGIDAAMSKSVALEDFTVVRGINTEAMNTILEKAGGSLKVGAVIQDKGYVSTTRKTSTAQNFAGTNGYGFKINIPKGANVLPVKHLSQYANEDEFLLPRGTTFKVTSIQGSVITVDLVM